MAKASGAKTKSAKAKTGVVGGFEGFLDEGKFWKALAKNQDRDWFMSHKHAKKAVPLVEWLVFATA